MDAQESPTQELTANTGDASARSEPSPKGKPTPPTTTSSSSRPRRLWSRLESAKNRLKALESPNSQPSSSQPQDDGPSSQGGSLPKYHDASTLNKTTDDKTTGNGIANTLSANEPPTEKPPASETVTRDPPASEHNEDKSEPDARNSPSESSGQGYGAASPPLMSVDKAAEDSTKLLGMHFGILLWTLVYRVICLEHRQGFHPEEYDKVQNVSVKVGEKLQDMHWHMRQRQQAAPAEHSGTATTQMTTETKPEITVMAMAQTPTVTKSEMVKAATTQLPVDIDQAIETMKAFQAESPETVEAKSAWLQRLDEFAKSMDAVEPPREAMARLGPFARQLIEKRKTIKAAIAEAKTAELPKMLEAISAQTPKETQEALTQAAHKAQKLKALRNTVAQLPEVAEDTELPIALKKRAANVAETLRRARTSLPTDLQKDSATPAHMWEAAQIFDEFKIAEAVITARLKVTEVVVEKPAADCKHAGPTYPWGIFQELEEAAKTTMDYEVSMARLGSEEREANLRDATGAQLRLKKIKFLLISIMTQSFDIALDLVLQGKPRV